MTGAGEREAIRGAVLPLLTAHGIKTRNSYYVRCRCGHAEGGASGDRPTLHEHEADMIADALIALGLHLPDAAKAALNGAQGELA